MKKEKSGDCNSTEICGQVQVPTDDELKALNKLRSIKVRVNEIKQRLSDKALAEEGNNENVELEKELCMLKVEWDEWVEKRETAARERMILLGHEKP